MNLGLQNNIAMNTNRQYQINNGEKAQAAKRLSSGYRINSAADDAAGLSISEKMRKQIRGLNKADQNIADGTNYVKVADGALSEVQNMMHRLSELSIQAANDTNTAADRLSIDTEVQALKKEINRIFIETEFNTKQIWTTDTDNRIPIGIERVPAVTVVNSSNPSISVTETNKWAFPNDSYYHISADADGVEVSWTAYNGVTYKADKFPWPADWTADEVGTSISFNINADNLHVNTPDANGNTHPELEGISFSLAYGIAEDATLDDVIQSINNTSLYSPVSLSSSATITDVNGNTTGSVSSDNNKASISFSTSISYAGMLAANRVFGGSDTNYIYPTTTDNYTDFANSTTGNWLGAFTMGTTQTTPAGEMYTSPPFSVSAASTSTSYTARSYSESDYWVYTDRYGYQSLNTKYPSPSDGTWNSIISALSDPNFPTTQYGIQLKVSSSLTGTYKMPDARDSLSSPLSTHDVTGSVGNIQMYITLTNDATAADIENALAKIKGLDIASSATGYFSPRSTPSLHTHQIDQTIYEAQINLNIQTSDVSYDHIELAYKSLRLQNLGLADTNTKTHADAQNAIAAAENALAIVSEQRSLFGAYQNRLEKAQSIVGNTSENVQSAESGLRDADISEEMLAFSKLKILTQAGEAVLAQGNSTMSQVLSLLQ